MYYSQQSAIKYFTILHFAKLTKALFINFPRQYCPLLSG